MTEDWKTGPHQLTYRQIERTFGLVARRPGKRPARRDPVRDARRDLRRRCSKPASPTSQGRHHRAGGGLDRPGNLLPPAADGTALRRPRSLLGAPPRRRPRQGSELFFGYYPSAATMVPEEHGPPVPELARRMTTSSCHIDPARALVPVLTRMPRQASPSATSWPTPATPTASPKTGRCRSAPPGPSSSRTCTPRPRPARHPRRGHHRQRQPVLPRHPQAAAGTEPAGPRRHPGPGQRARHPVRRASPATSSAGSPPTTPTATTGSCAPPSWARSAARSAPPPWPWTVTGPRSSPHPGTRQPAAHSRPSPSRPRSPRRPGQKHHRKRRLSTGLIP